METRKMIFSLTAAVALTGVMPCQLICPAADRAGEVRSWQDEEPSPELAALAQQIREAADLVKALSGKSGERAETAPGTAAENTVGTVSETGALTGSETETVSESITETEVLIGSVFEALTETASEAAAGSLPEAETVSEPAAETEYETEYESFYETEYGTDEENVSETESVTEAETEVETDRAPEAEGIGDAQRLGEAAMSYLQAYKESVHPGSTAGSLWLSLRREFFPGLEDERYLPLPVSFRLSPAGTVIRHFGVEVPDKHVSMIRETLTQLLDGYEGIWSMCLRDLTTDEELVYNERSMPSASVYKLFILGAVYEAIDEGRLSRTDELSNLMTNMITVSSNEAANRLIYLLGGQNYRKGIAQLNRYTKAHGYSWRTRGYNPFQDASLFLYPDRVNMTCPTDVALLLERVYHRTFGRRAVCNEVEELMLNQTLRYKIPAGIGDAARVGNKTGETDDIENDVAVVYTPWGDYILCVFSTGWKDKTLAQTHIKELSGEVYAYYSDPDYVIHRYGLAPLPEKKP